MERPGGSKPGGSKFANRSLNAQVGLQRADPVRKVGGQNRGNLLFISTDAKRVAKPIGAAAAPVALNTPSIKKENNGKDVSINLVPVGVSSVWGQSDSKQDEAAEQQQQQQSQQQQQQTSSIAPWARGPESKDSSAAPAPQRTVARPSWVDLNEEEEENDGYGRHAQGDDRYQVRTPFNFAPFSPSPFSLLLLSPFSLLPSPFYFPFYFLFCFLLASSYN